MAMFTHSANLDRAIAIINELEVKKLPLLLSRILQKIHIQDESTFTSEEQTKLESALSLSLTDLDLVIESLELIFHQAAYHNAKPTVLGDELSKLGLSEDRVAAVVNSWTAGGRDLIAKLRQQSIAPQQLTGIGWRLHLSMADKCRANQKQMTSMWEFDVQDNAAQKQEKIQVEMTHSQLYNFYNQLETIQTQLDQLN